MTQLSDLFEVKYSGPLEEELRETFAGQQGLLHNMLLYQLGWMDEQGTPLTGPSGERRHPLLCLLSCESVLGEYVPALPAAAAVELVHNFCLIHEDVQIGSPNRGPRPTVWWIWGPGQAINAGDGMHALARLALMRLQDRGIPVARVIAAMRLFDRSCLNICEGQHLDLVFQERLDVGVNAYLKMAADRTGGLMSCAMGLGALAGTDDDTVVEAFKSCGEYLGIAYQIKSDILDLQASSSEEMPSSNLLNKKKLLPIVHALETGEIKSKRELGTIYFKRVLEPPDIQKIMDILSESSAFEYAQERVDEYCQKAMRALEGIDISAWGRAELEKLCQKLISRER